MFEKFREERAEQHALKCAAGKHSWKTTGKKTAHTFGGGGDAFKYTVKIRECRWCGESERTSSDMMCPECGAVNSISHEEEVDPGYSTDTCSHCGESRFGGDFSVPCLDEQRNVTFPWSQLKI